ncbi:DUF481 domain-containing protein [Flavobacterium sp. SORGH_AS_0622]|uniref:DUF481 domain-containing protein n=1 Tax=Flavobacterium sp. SORGH_AS_0622 TaxID=3041772 RepID=UPI002785DE92|nr:DUF481 domain-containing protein [Flavobacterium sp. SORGH_AS_0622]MDQ1166466.1 hypothetical protein [Flavobacterium sp. SORGH_AS_0622]
MNKIGLFILLLISLKSMSQSDTLILKNENLLIGKVKLMSGGIIQLETNYSKDDFKIKWKEVKYFSSPQTHIITLASGELLNGAVMGIIDSLKCKIIEIDTKIIKTVNLSEIVYIKTIDVNFWDRLDISFDVGFKLTKAQNLKQLSINSSVGYNAKRWFATGTYKQIQSVQDQSEKIQRIDSDFNYVYLLPKDYFITGSISTLSNTEQEIQLRVISKGGYGRYLFRDNNKYWGIALGLSYNHERYQNEKEINKSLEFFSGTELNFYDIGDFSISSKLLVFPSLTEKKRVRTDFNLDTKYDLPLNFFIKLSFVYNYDNKPVANSSKDDYVFQTSFGWKLN